MASIGLDLPIRARRSRVPSCTGFHRLLRRFGWASQSHSAGTPRLRAPCKKWWPSCAYNTRPPPPPEKRAAAAAMACALRRLRHEFRLVGPGEKRFLRGAGGPAVQADYDIELSGKEQPNDRVPNPSTASILQLHLSSPNPDHLQLFGPLPLAARSPPPRRPKEKPNPWSPR